MSVMHLNRYVSECAVRHKIREQDTIVQTSVLAKGMANKQLPYKVNIRSSHVAFLTHYPLTFAFLSTFLPPALETRRVFCYIVSMATSQQLQSGPGPTCVSTKDDAATPFSRNTIEDFLT